MEYAFILMGCGTLTGAVAGYFIDKRVATATPGKIAMGISALLITACMACLFFAHVVPLTLYLALCVAWGATITTRSRDLEPAKKGRPQYNYCPNCAEALEERDFDGKKKLACSAECGFVHWDNPRSVAVALVPSADGTKLLLIQRNIPPFVGSFALPGGFVDTNEGLDPAAIREVLEETGLNIDDVRFFWSAPTGRNENLIFFTGRLAGGEITLSSETMSVDFFTPEQLLEKLASEDPNSKIAFPLHKQAIQMWLESRKA
jgi:ADP-ribose pyrophosphatase YjhB (NUDIX family)